MLDPDVMVYTNSSFSPHPCHAHDVCGQKTVMSVYIHARNF